MALLRVMEEPFDLILTDISLPNMDGYQFASLERTWEKITSHTSIPIVGLSAQLNDNQIIESEIDLLLNKPLDQEKIDEIKLKFFPENFSHT